jgi:hypothetical protein
MVSELTLDLVRLQVISYDNNRLHNNRRAFRLFWMRKRRLPKLYNRPVNVRAVAQDRGAHLTSPCRQSAETQGGKDTGHKGD